MGLTEERLSGMDWPELALRLDEAMSLAELERFLPTAMKFHTSVSLRMATHLSLTLETINRSHWLAAQMLSTTPSEAKAGARTFLDHILRLREDQMSKFEESFSANETLMSQLGLFVDDPDEGCLWHKGNRYKDLYRYLAGGFLGAPDAVLPCEGVHAKWKWLTIVKRGMKFKLLNALLKLYDDQQSMGSLPDMEDLVPHITNAAAAYRSAFNATAGQEGFQGRRSDAVYLCRFNLRACDLELLKDAAVANRADTPQTAATAWGMYVRFLMTPGMVYKFMELTDNLYFFVAENKSFPNRDVPAPDKVVGRPLALCWLRRQACPDASSNLFGGEVLTPCDDADATTLPLTHASVAEMCRTAGAYPNVSLTATERDVELGLEASFLTHNLLAFECARVRTGDCPWAFAIPSMGDNVEDVAFLGRDYNALTKMAMARMLQLRNQVDSDARDELWRTRSKAELAAEMMDVGLAPAAVPAPVAAAPAAIRGGRGGARGRGGKGRGGKAVGARGGRAGRGRGKAKGGRH
jgi:hypothetical protein